MKNSGTNRTKENEVAQKKTEPIPLKISERIAGLIVSILLFGFAVNLLINPPFHYTVIEKTDVNQKSNVIEKTKTNSDQSTVIVTLLTAGFVFAIYSINGLRFNKLSVDKVAIDSASSTESTITNPSITINQRRPTENQNILFENFTKIEKKILRTLWLYQNIISYENYEKLWTFTLFDNHPEYREFLKAVGILQEKGLVFEDPDSKQVALDDAGINLMQSTSKSYLETIEFYPFNVVKD